MLLMHNYPTVINEEPVRNGACRRVMSFASLALALLALAATVPAQEALRSSLAIGEAERARRSQADVPYNIKLGEAKLRFSTSLGVEYNDNINVSETGQVEDFILRPEVTTDLFWAVTDQNAVNLSLGLGYAKYLDNDDSDSLQIRPGSLLSFDVYVDDLRINLHDRFSFYQDPIQQGAVSGTNAINSQYGQGENVVGVGLEWDLNKLVLGAGFDYSMNFATSDAFDYLNRDSQFFFLRPAVLVAPELTAGIELTGGLTQYDQSQLNDSEQYSLGPFLDWQVSRYMRLGVRAGYQSYSFDGVTNATDTSSYYASLTLDHELNRYVRYSFGGGHLVSLGVNSDAINLTFVRLTARWALLRQTDLTTDIFFEHGQETGSTAPETFDRIGFSIGAGYHITRHLSSTLRYSFTDKDSDQPLRGYRQNQVQLFLRYLF